MEKKKLYQKNWFIIVMIVVFFPVGLYLMWKYAGFHRIVKIIVTAFIAIAIVGNIASTHSTKTTHQTEGKVSEKSEQSNKSGVKKKTTKLVTPSFKKAMDEYEEFFDEYVVFMKKYNKNLTDAELLKEYSTYMSKYADAMDALNKIDSKKLSVADNAYYLKVQSRITKKLSAVA